MPITQTRMLNLLTIAETCFARAQHLADETQALRDKYFNADLDPQEKAQIVIILCNLIESFSEIDREDYFVVREERLHFKLYGKRNVKNAEYVRRHRARKKSDQDSLTEQALFQNENRQIDEMFRDVPKPESKPKPEPESEPVEIPDWCSVEAIAERQRKRQEAAMQQAEVGAPIYKV